MMGREVRWPTDPHFSMKESEITLKDAVTYALELKQNLAEVHQLAKSCFGDTQRHQKERYNLKATCQTFQVGDLVYLWNQSRQIGSSPKLQASGSGHLSL